MLNICCSRSIFVISEKMSGYMLLEHYSAFETYSCSWSIWLKAPGALSIQIGLCSLRIFDLQYYAKLFILQDHMLLFGAVGPGATAKPNSYRCTLCPRSSPLEKQNWRDALWDGLDNPCHADDKCRLQVKIIKLYPPKIKILILFAKFDFNVTNSLKWVGLKTTGLFVTLASVQ